MFPLSSSIHSLFLYSSFSSFSYLFYHCGFFLSTLTYDPKSVLFLTEAFFLHFPLFFSLLCCPKFLRKGDTYDYHTHSCLISLMIFSLVHPATVTQVTSILPPFLSVLHFLYCATAEVKLNSPTPEGSKWNGIKYHGEFTRIRAILILVLAEFIKVTDYIKNSCCSIPSEMHYHWKLKDGQVSGTSICMAERWRILILIYSTACLSWWTIE